MPARRVPAPSRIHGAPLSWLALYALCGAPAAAADAPSLSPRLIAILPPVPAPQQADATTVQTGARKPAEAADPAAGGERAKKRAGPTVASTDAEADADAEAAPRGANPAAAAKANRAAEPQPPMRRARRGDEAEAGASEAAQASAGSSGSAPGKAESAAASKPGPRARAAASRAEPAGRHAGEPDSMDKLRELLAEKLGAKQSPQSHSRVVRITARSPEPGAAAAGPRRSKPPAPAGAALLAARHRAETGQAAQVPGGAASTMHAAVGPWSYVGDTGPEQWARLKPEYAACASGERQSPIDIRDGIRVQLDPVQFDYVPSGFEVLDNGHTVQVNVDAGNSIEVMGRRYDLQHVHFHLPAEERVNGRGFAMAAHLVHRSADGRPAVVAVLLERGAAHAVVQSVWNNLPLERHDALRARQPIDLKLLLPAERSYYTYMGSLTTPPCTEGVLWMVMKQPQTVSVEQIAIFARLYPMNARPVQSAAGRLIKESQ